MVRLRNYLNTNGRCVAISTWEGNLRHGVAWHQRCERHCGWEPRCIDHLLAGSLAASTICWLARHDQGGAGIHGDGATKQRLPVEEKLSVAKGRCAPSANTTGTSTSRGAGKDADPGGLWLEEGGGEGSSGNARRHY